MNFVYFAKSTALPDQYYEIGKINEKHIKQSVKVNKRRWSKKIQERRLILNKIYQRITSERIFTEFTRCLLSWAKGAGINPLQALELMDDNTGCQTAIGKYMNGIVLIHTEEELEDIKERMTTPQIVAFRIDNEWKYTLIYNNILPGAAVYGWSNNYAIAVDALFLNEDEVGTLERPMLANIISWLIWRNQSNDLSIKTVTNLIKKAGNYLDGYTINIVTNQPLLQAYKLTFAREIIEIESLPNKTGETMRQLNIIDPKYIEQKKLIANCRLPYQRFYRGYHRYYKERLAIIDHDIASYAHYLQRKITNHQEMHDKIINELAGPLASHYMNEVVGAVCTTLIEEAKISTAIGLVEEAKLKKIEYF